ncbi:serine/threonine protein kinase [Nonomuraea roseoviolacea]|uniref:Serine/threonine protein kinase n=1 Tax=Nonomuraea roseoviolacea subsp. carminata TaxID=160689 RepID=A0ABT1JY26_9ACTN|nr:serine/threonine protein kinase [Nonomuraea roseoviolacea]MCP2346146.1 serine/threonine protein kinase [Nonomuraea roseoviolacea subsp. carminata]
MPSIAPLRPGDPLRLAGLELTGRLGEGGQGVVYLAKDPAGAQFAVKWLRHDLAADRVSVERFLREAQVAQRIAPFCTAAVLGSGVEQDRPYIVSEFIEGPSLQRIVQEEGPRAGASLHRLAIGTATALAAIHQAGIVHRDVKPANVILGADGPRVIDFGIARALNATSTISGMPVGTPSYMPPEQILGHPAGPAADMFSWASTMVYAASARAPFGSDTMPAVINRVLNNPPDLGVLDGPLRELVAACLDKDPARRPTAEQVLMRLIQQPGQTGQPLPPLAQAGQGSQGQMASHGQVASQGQVASPGQVASQGQMGQPTAHGQAGQGGRFQQAPPPWGPFPQQGPPSGPVPGPGFSTPPPPMAPGSPPRRKSRAPVIVGVTAAVTLLLLAGVAVIVSQRKPTAAMPKPSATSSSRRSTATPSEQVTQAPVRKRLPGGSISLYELPADPVTLTSYEVYDKKADDWVDYARKTLRGSAFQKYSANWETLVSPDGRYLATRGRKYTGDGYDSVIITDRTSGATSTVKTVRKPQISSIRAWSRDGSKLLLNIEKETKNAQGKEDWLYPGFVLVDVAEAKAGVVRLPGGQAPPTTGFGWDAEQRGVVNLYGSGKGLRFYDAAGKTVRDIPGVGSLASGTQDIFSPSGKAFVTKCPDGGDGDHCVWDSATGERVRKFSSDCDKVLGWFDETHLYCWEQDNASTDQIQVVGFDGRLVRKLLEVPDDLDFSPVFTVNPGRGG